MKVLIIEDEVRSAKEMIRLLQAVDDATSVVGVIDSVENGIEWFSKNEHPDLIFSDIQLADGLSFEIFNSITIKSPIIFCTAFDEYMMSAFDTNAVSYLLKPITRDKIEKALEKYVQLKSFFVSGQGQPGIPGLLKQLQNGYKRSLLVHLKEKIIPVAVENVAFFYLDKTILYAVTLDNQKYHYPSSLDELEKQLDPVEFYRANRQFIIGKKSIENAEKFFARKLVAKLRVRTPEPVIISKARASDFLHWLES